MSDSIITDGTGQRDRTLAATQEGYFHVDEMRLEELIAMTIDYARLLKFFTVSNVPDGDWEVFFTSDEMVIMAMIMTTDTTKTESELAHFLKRIELNYRCLENSDALQHIPIYALARKLNSWLEMLDTVDGVSGARLRDLIMDLMEKNVGTALRALRDFLAQYNPNLAVALEQALSRLWQVGVRAPNPQATVPSPSSDTHSITRFLKQNFYYFFNAVAILKKTAQGYLPDSAASQTHSASVGLYVAFVMLFQKVQQRINGFTQKHLQFYYYDILKTRPRSLASDSAFLVLRTDGENRKIPITAGSEFTAREKGAHDPLLYALDADLLVDDTKVTSLYTLFFERNPLVSPESKLRTIGDDGNSRQFISSVKKNHTSPLTGPSQSANPDLRTWPLFGAPKQNFKLRLLEEADMGFAVASPVLLLKEGQREIDISFKIDYLQEPHLDAVVAQVADLEKTTQQDVFFKIFREMFKIDLTSTRGWLPIIDYLPSSWLVDPTCEENCLKFKIALSPDRDPITPYLPEIHGQGYDTDLPLIRFVLNPRSVLYPYSLLQNLTLKEIHIKVDVRGVRQLKFYSDFGQLNTDLPFNPFGPMPALGSSFIVGNVETMGKQLTAFEVDLEWGNLPLGRYGFKDLYQGYGMSFNSRVFEAGISVLRGGQWLPDAQNNQPRLTLFETYGEAQEGEDNTINKRRTLSCKSVLRFFRPTQDIATHDELVYNSLAKDGFFKFTLLSPEYAFGHKDYPMVLANALSTNARLKKVALHKPVPNPPYTPLINSISLHYSAVSNVHLEHANSHKERPGEEKLFHIHPFGTQSLVSARYKKTPLIPRYDTAGNLFIGLSARQCSTMLTLFFHLRDDSIPVADGKKPGFSWYYLSSNQWKKLHQAHVLSDTTHGFLASGIITLTIPEDINTNNTIMPSNLFWLRVSVRDYPETVCSAYSLHAQALKVTWKPTHNDAPHLSTGLPAGTITGSRLPIPGIVGIEQVTDSFGGKPPESREQLIVRMSERLRHKNRAVTPWDYERLILQNFPEIVKVKCFANTLPETDPEKRVRPGHVLIVVVPSSTPDTGLRPMANAYLLDRIKTHVKKVASPFAAITVRNPAYEQIQIRCRVKLRPGSNDGYRIRTLNRALTDYLSPWSHTGYSVYFGWCVRRYDIESFLTQLEFVEFVTDFSMLHIAETEKGVFRLFDTARDLSDEIRPLFPWSLGIPLEEHFIQTTEAAQPIQPAVTGIDELMLGSTFILSGGQGHGEEK